MRKALAGFVSRTARQQNTERTEPSESHEYRRKPFDPLAPGALSIQDVASLAASAENVLKKGDLDILVAAAMALLAWRQAEINKADSVNLTVNGVTNGEVEVYPGRKIFMEAKVLLHDADLRAAHHDTKPGDETTISITHRKPRN